MKCENCDIEHDGSYGSGRFCSCKCARGFSTKAKRKEINEKVSKKLKEKKQHRKKKVRKAQDFRIAKCKHCSEFKIIKKRKSICEDCRNTFYKYYKFECGFKFNVYDYPQYFDLKLIEKFGFYRAKNRGNNLNGIVRDHIYSVSDGFKNGIDPQIISHPANCRLMRQNKNAQKRDRSDITLKELIKNINLFETKWPND